MTCDHVPRSDDPRRASACFKCGRTIPDAPIMERDLEFQRKAIESAAESVGHSHLAERLLAAALKRTDPGPVSLANGRDLVAEYVEETLDQVNYGTWELQRLQDLGGDNATRAAAVVEALKHTILAYDALRRASS